MDLFDELDLPATLYLPDSPGRWKRTLNAQWADLVASAELRDATCAAMLDEARTFAQAIEALRPVMQPDPEMTVRQALALMGGQR